MKNGSKWKNMEESENLEENSFSFSQYKKRKKRIKWEKQNSSHWKFPVLGRKNMGKFEKKPHQELFGSFQFQKSQLPHMINK